jgi:hypothetical protein
LSRPAIRYGDLAVNHRAAPAVGFRVEEPTAGFYRYRMVKGGHPVGVRIWFGPPLDPVTGEELDRGHRWQATVNRVLTDLDRVWPGCGREPIDRAEHDHLCALQAWAIENAPDAPQADPRRPINMMTAPLPL